MSDDRCRAKTKSGEQCKLKADSYGYCHIHAPNRMAKQLDSPIEKNQRVVFKRFSQRKGFKQVLETIQVNGMNDELRYSIWNVLSHLVMQQYYGSRLRDMLDFDETYDDFAYHLWTDFFKKPITLIPNAKPDVLEEIFKYFSSCEWYEVYDFLEYILNYVDRSDINDAINDVLERELSGYRFVGGVITDITDEQEVEMIKHAVFVKGKEGHLTIENRTT